MQIQHGGFYMKHKLMFFSILIVSVCLPTAVFAAPLSGRLTIDPMFFATETILDANGNPIEMDVYQGGSYFSMQGFNPYNAVSLDSTGYDGIILNTHQNYVLDPDEPHPDGHPDAPFGAGCEFQTIPTTHSI